MRLLRNLRLDQVFVLDIKTVPCVGCYDDLAEMLQHLWEHKCHSLRREKGGISAVAPSEPMPDDLPAAALFEQAGIYAEFGKVVCISLGCFYYDKQEQLRFYLKSFAGHDEAQLLRDFAAVLEKKPDYLLCGHDSKEFDIPYVSRRLLVNGLSLPPQLDTAGKKPGEVTHLDTLELWKFGDQKSSTSLALLAAMFDIPAPKADLTSTDVARLYHEAQDLPRIVYHCQKDVITTARLLLKFRGDESFPDAAVHYADEPVVLMRRV